MILDKIKQQLAALEPERLETVDYATKGFHLDVKVAPEQVVAVAEIMDREKFFLELVTGVDWLPEALEAAKPKPQPKAAAEGEDSPPAEPPPEPEPVSPEMEVVYDYRTTGALCRIVVRTRIPRDNPELPTISSIFPGGNWHERETHDFFGIRFVGHPDLTPLLLPEDADFHPLLKG